MDEDAQAPEPEDADVVDEVQPAGCRLAAQHPEHAPVPRPTLCRHSLKVGAQCGSSARWDLCGGRGAIPVPTAIEAGQHPLGVSPAEDQQVVGALTPSSLSARADKIGGCTTWRCCFGYVQPREWLDVNAHLRLPSISVRVRRQGSRGRCFADSLHSPATRGASGSIDVASRRPTRCEPAP